ncbi:hypothetical protein F5Y06DRAFT_307866 [Hypoxylon sp. FL0890]|nr:hypothetical protein F5Y06DRAFT_307866 [Hypoxylon sp. FL0890]
MAPKKRGNSGKRENPFKKPKPTKTGVPDSGYETDHNGQPAVLGVIGVVLNNGLFECRVHVEGQRCGARMINERTLEQKLLVAELGSLLVVSFLAGGFSRRGIPSREWPWQFYRCRWLLIVHRDLKKVPYSDSQGGQLTILDVVRDTHLTKQIRDYLKEFRETCSRLLLIHDSVRILLTAS